jgi:hypothetical protein
MEVIGQIHTLVVLPRGQNAGYYGIEGWVARMAGWDDMETENSLVRAGIRTPVG